MGSTITPKLKNYVLEQEIGRGDLTIVYQGRRKSDNATVAVKVVAPQFTFDELFVRRFLDMGKQAAKLDHTNIVRTYEASKEDDTLFLVREFVEARPVAEILAEEGPFLPQRTLGIARQVAAALDYAHQKSIMHGDLSASRVYLTENDHVIVADFGQMQAIAGTSLVKQGFAVGSPEVLSPERVRGQGPSRQSDLYSLGVLCYQMLNGEPPFVGEAAAVLHAQAYEQPHPLHVANPGVSLRLSEVIGRMLSKGLELRYTTGSEFTRALTVAAEGTSPIRISSTSTGQLNADMGQPTALWQRPWVWGLLAIPLMVMLLCAGFLAVRAWFSWLGTSENIEATSQPVAAAATTPIEATSISPTNEPPPSVVEIEATSTVVAPATSIPTATLLPPAPTLLPTATPTLVSLPTPGPPVIAQNSPFTNIQLAHGIGIDDQPQNTGTSFLPGAQPIYLFFDYAGLEPGTPWTHRWVWGDIELDTFEDTWSDSFAESGTAWIFFSPIGGYQPGPYEVTLEVNGQTVVTATFVVQPGGI